MIRFSVHYLLQLLIVGIMFYISYIYITGEVIANPETVELHFKGLTDLRVFGYLFFIFSVFCLIPFENPKHIMIAFLPFLYITSAYVSMFAQTELPVFFEGSIFFGIMGLITLVIPLYIVETERLAVKKYLEKTDSGNS